MKVYLPKLVAYNINNKILLCLIENIFATVFERHFQLQCNV
jgi:hypothetical protein